MTGSNIPRKFSKICIEAFPASCRPLAEEAGFKLKPFIDHSYQVSSAHAVVQGEVISIPQRIYFCPDDPLQRPLHIWASPIIDCLYTRSTDGYLRQKALGRLLAISDPCVIPYVVLLAGEYVVEITIDLCTSIPKLDQQAYINFVHENQALMSLTKSRATSYWNCYYRNDYPEKNFYPGLFFLHQFEHWASE